MRTWGSRRVLSARQARGLERAIIGLSVASLALIFQPFSLTLFGVGAGLAVIGGLAFNLVPLCRPGIPVRKVANVGLIVLAILVAIGLLAIGSAYLYAAHLQNR
jgi:O-antigen ligase